MILKREKEPIDGYISYRLIEPSYVAWTTMEITQRDLTDELLLGMLQLEGAEFLLAEFFQFLVNQSNGLFQRIRVNAHVDADEADVGVGGILRFDAVSEAVFLANVQPKARTHGRTT